MRLLPTTTFAGSPQLDLVCVPGGAGMNALLNDEETLDFVRRQASGARYVTSVCTGSLVLGAAGLLKGRRATTHWMSLPMLAAFGCEPVAERVVVDGNVITGGGVTAGIDFALTVAGEWFGAETARRIQLGIEYDPHPPYDAGAPEPARMRRWWPRCARPRRRARGSVKTRCSGRRLDSGATDRAWSRDHVQFVTG